MIFFRPSFSIDNAHPPYVRDVDYNPNRQYYLMTCGDDCRVKFWDVRKTNECLKILSDHSHWFVSLRFNSMGKIIRSKRIESSRRNR